MANPFFKFKQFTVWHDRCAMKVGTDGVLLGVLAPVNHKVNILDIGTGTGLVALMLAQRNLEAQLTALEIDTDAAKQATQNIGKSPWSSRIDLVHTDFKTFEPDAKYDLIVSNPPYFANSLLSGNDSKDTARHTVSLSFEDLLSGVSRILDMEGTATFIIPSDAKDEFIAVAKAHRLNLARCVYIHTQIGVEPKRVVLSFSFDPYETEISSLVIELERHIYSEEFRELTKDFYLKH